MLTARPKADVKSPDQSTLPINDPSGCATAAHTEEYRRWAQTTAINTFRMLEGPYRIQRVRIDAADGCPSKIIYLMYDRHDKNTGCGSNPNAINVVDFFKTMLGTCPYVIDTIIEAEPDANDRNGENRSHMSTLGFELKACLQRHDRSGCNFRNARVHFNDWRDYFVDPKLSLKLYLQNLHNASAVEFYTRILKENRRTLEEWDVVLRKHANVDKELSKCPDNVRDVIDNWLKEAVKDQEIADAVQQFNDWVDQGLRPDQAPKNPFGAGAVLGIPYMDAYTVARMFKRFSSKHGEYAKDMRNIFVYTGGTHCEHYVEILRRLGGVVEVDLGEPNITHRDGTDVTQCIDITSLQPLKFLNTQI